MDIEYLQSFIETVKHKSISKASDALQLTHTALSKQIRRVEEHFGVSLFRRSTSGVELTEEGSLFLTRIQPILHEFESLREELQAIQRSKRSFSIGTLPTLAAYYLPAKILEMEKNQIKINLMIRSHSVEIQDLLQSGALDCAIIEPNVLQKYVWSKELYREPLYVVLPDHHPLANRSSLTLYDICDQDFVLYPNQCTIRNRISQLFQTIEKTIHIQAEVDYGEFLMGYVAAGAGITVVPEIYANHLGHPHLRAVRIDHVDAVRTVAIVSASEWIGKLLYEYVRNG